MLSMEMQLSSAYRPRLATSIFLQKLAMTAVLSQVSDIGHLQIAEIAKVLGNVRNAEQQGCLRQNAYVAMARESPLVSIRQAKSITSV